MLFNGFVVSKQVLLFCALRSCNEGLEPNNLNKRVTAKKKKSSFTKGGKVQEGEEMEVVQ